MPITYTAQKPEHTEYHVEPGDYRLRVIEAAEDTSKGGNDMIKLKLRVILPDGSDGPTLFDYLVFTETCFWKIDHFLKSCGRHPGEGAAVSIDAGELTGWECEASLKVETFEGHKSNKVAAYLWNEGF